MSTTFDPDLYWGTVEDCLVEIHHLEPSEARRRLAMFKRSLEMLPPGVNPNIIYHTEQFDLACDLAGRELDSDEYRDAYSQIMIRHYPDVGVYLERSRSHVDRVAADASGG